MKKKGKLKVKNILIFLVCFLLVGGFFVCYFFPQYILVNTNKLKITLNGKKEIVLNYKEEYIDEGAKASYEDIDLTDQIEVTNDINYNKVGKYKYTYTIKYKSHEKKVERTILIQDTEKPSLELIGDQEETVIQDNKYNDKGIIAIDNYDGILQI